MLKRNTLLIALILVMILFEIAIQSTGHGSLFSPSNFTNIIYQNSYVIILAVGMPVSYTHLDVYKRQSQSSYS